jgi:hypothetical protein
MRVYFPVFPLKKTFLAGVFTRYEFITSWVTIEKKSCCGLPADFLWTSCGLAKIYQLRLTKYSRADTTHHFRIAPPPAAAAAFAALLRLPLPLPAAAAASSRSPQHPPPSPPLGAASPCPQPPSKIIDHQHHRLRAIDRTPRCNISFRQSHVAFVGWGYSSRRLRC